MQQFFRKTCQGLSSIPFIKHLLMSIVYLAVGLITLIITLHLPLSERAAYLFRHGYSLWLVAAGIFLYLGFKIPGSLGKIISYCLVVILFALPLSALWRQGYAEMQMIGGVLHFSDSAQYYHNASRLLEGYPFTAFGTRHPFAPALIATLLTFTGQNLIRTTAALIFFNAVSVFFTADILRKSQHPLIASAFVVLSFLFFRRFIGMTDTENLGLLFGMLGFALLWIGACSKKASIIYSGALVTSCGLNARPGPFLILPALLVWFAIYFPREKRSRTTSKIVLLGIVMLIPFVLNIMLASALGSTKPGVFSNFAYTLYGIADGGTGWEQIYRDHPEIYNLSESEASRLAYRLAVEKIKTNPGEPFLSLKNAYSDFFSLKNRSAFGFVSGGDLTAFDQPDPGQRLGYTITRAGLWVLCLSGLIWLWRQRTRPECGLLLWGLVGILFSVPFLPPRDAAIMRVYAAAMPYVVLLPTVGLRWILPKRDEKDGNQQALYNTAAVASTFAVFLISLTVLGSLSLRLFRHPVPVMDHTCPPGAIEAALRVKGGSYLHVRTDDQALSTHIPVILHSKFIQNLRQFPNAEKVGELTALSPPFLLLNAVNLKNGQMLWAVAPTGVLNNLNQTLLVCGNWMPELMENGLGFLYIDAFNKLD